MKFKFDRYSIKFRICMYFIVFAVLLLIILWFLQVFFLNTFYQSMKATKTQQVAKEIATAYQDNNLQAFVDLVTDIADSNDMYIHITNLNGSSFFISSRDNTFQNYSGEMMKVREKMAESNSAFISLRINNDDSRQTLACGSLLFSQDKDSLIAYIFSPLYPMSSTIEILTNQLIYVTIISLLLAFVLSFYLATRISMPIRAITKSAQKLAEGKFGVVFRGGQYTELHYLADTLTTASIALEKSAMLQKDLIANVSHDLRTPLTMVKSYAEMVRDLSGDNPAKRNAHLQVIIDEADRLNVLVGDMLTLSRMQSGAMVLKKERVNLYEVIENIRQTYRLLMEEDGYKITLTCRNDLMVMADKEKIKQVLANLINNGLKFCGEDKTVEIMVKRKGRSIQCQISDRGIGIPADELPHIWERYYRASSNMVRSTSGSGLGLSIVKEILALHKVNYGVNSTLNQGTTFWFELDAASGKTN